MIFWQSFLRTFLILTILISSSGNLIAQDTLRISWTTWSPHQMKGRDGKLTGVDIELITEIFKRT